MSSTPDTTKKIAHNTAIQIVGKALSTFLGLIAIGMMTRYLGAEQFGWYVTTIAFLQFIGILIDFGLIPVTAQMLSEPEHDKGSLLQALLGFRLSTAVLFLVLAPLLAMFFPYPPQVKIAISFTTISFLSIAMNQVLVGYYQTKLKMHIQAAGEIIGRIVLVLGLWLFMSKGASFLPIMWIIVLSSVAYTIFMWVFASKEVQTKPIYDKELYKSIAKKMWPVAISIIFNVVYLKGDTVLLSIFRTQAEVGIYGAAYRVIDILSQTAMMLMGVMLPVLAYHFSRMKKEQFQKYYQLAFDAMMMLAVPMSVGAIMLAKPIMILIAGEQFASAATPLRILAIAVFGLYLGAVFGHTAVAINKQKQTMWIYISDAILTLIGYLYFIPKFGMTGAAGMTVFSELYAGVLLMIVVSRFAGSFVKLHTFFKITLSSLIMAAALHSFQELHVLLLVVIGIFTYIAMMFSFGGISIATVKELAVLRRE